MSTALATLARRSTVTIVTDGHEVTYSKVRFVYADGRARAFDANGNLLATDNGELTPTGVKPRSWAFVGEAGSWTITEPRGCGCG